MEGREGGGEGDRTTGVVVQPFYLSLRSTRLWRASEKGERKRETECRGAEEEAKERALLQL